MIKYLKKGYNEDLLIISGWGFDPYVFDFERLPFNLIVPKEPLLISSISDILHNIKKECFVLGWSYGAHIACDIFDIRPDLIKGLILVSLSISFDKRSIKDTIKKLKKDKIRTLKEFYLFCFKGQKEDYKQFKKHHEKRCMHFWNTADLISALNYLSYHRVNILRIKHIPLLIINGKNDIFESDLQLHRYAKIKIKNLDSGHLPFLKDKFYDEISLFKKGYK